MSEQHTPGPWRACKDGACSCRQIWSLSADSPVAQANAEWGDDLKHPYGAIPVDQAQANARLIAAAPDLLAALTRLESYLDAIVCYASTMDEHEPNRIAAEARAAIAKARGAA